MVTPREAGRVHGPRREQLQLNLRPPQAPREVSPQRARVAGRLLLRTEEAINKQLSHIHALDVLAYARLCRIYRATGFRPKSDFNVSFLPTMQRLPSGRELREAAAAVESVVQRHLPPKAGEEYLSTQERDALFARGCNFQIEILRELGSLFGAGKNKEFLQALGALREGFESGSSPFFERTIYLLLSVDRVAEDAGQLLPPRRH